MLARRLYLLVVGSCCSVEKASTCDQGRYALHHPSTLVRWLRGMERQRCPW
jgi:hypothetical protein